MKAINDYIDFYDFYNGLYRRFEKKLTSKKGKSKLISSIDDPSLKLLSTFSQDDKESDGMCLLSIALSNIDVSRETIRSSEDIAAQFKNGYNPNYKYRDYYKEKEDIEIGILKEFVYFHLQKQNNNPFALKRLYSSNFACAYKIFETARCRKAIESIVDVLFQLNASQSGLIQKYSHLSNKSKFYDDVVTDIL